METKDLIALGLIFMGVLAGTGAACVSQRLREAAFFFMVAGAAITHKLDINFLSHFWYRGTTRGVEISFVDVLALSVFVSSLLTRRPGQPRWYWPASLGLMLLYFFWAFVSVTVSEPKIYGVFELSKIVRGILLFLAAAMFIRSEREVTILVVALACTVCLEGALALKQRYVDGLDRVSGSVEHPNSFSMYLCLVAPVFVAAATSSLHRYVRYLCCAALGAATISIFLTVSRAGIPIFAFVVLCTAALCVSWRPTLTKVAVAGLICIGLAGMFYKSWDTLKARYMESSFEQEYLDEEVEGRGYYLRLANLMMQERFLGVGLNNWSYWVSKEYGPRLGSVYEDYDDLAQAPNRDDVPDILYAAPAHNLAALTVGELGVPGLILFVLLWLRWFQMGASFLWRRSTQAMHRLGIGIFFGLSGLFLQSVTEWTYRQTHILFTCHLLLGTLAALYWLKRKRKRERVIAAVKAPMPEATELEPVAA